MDTQKTALLIADLGYGDAGKGSVVDYLARVMPVRTVVRYNGGSQAAHNVVTPDGRHHTFSQFGSATFIPGVKTYLSRFMVLHPLAMLSEERHLQSLGVHDGFARTLIDRRALVTTPFQQAANRLKELARGDARHGSCGMGVGETMSDWLTYGEEVLHAGELSNRAAIIRKLKWIRDAKIAQLTPLMRQFEENQMGEEERATLLDDQVIELTADLFVHFARQVEWVDSVGLCKIIDRPGVTLFEGAQGVLLDEWWGFYPYNSWSTLTFKNANTLLAEAGFQGATYRLGLIRGYATRHGAGPFVTEDQELSERLQDNHNLNNPWQRAFRVGYLDLVALRYALAVSGKVDGIGVTNLDRMDGIAEWRLCEAYRPPQLEPGLGRYFDCQGGIINTIKIPADPTDLQNQETLTRLLMEMKPVYSDCHMVDREDYLAQVSQKLGIPVALKSWGPTAGEKEWMA